MGPRPRDLRRGPTAHTGARGPFRACAAGRAPSLPQGDGHTYYRKTRSRYLTLQGCTPMCAPHVCTRRQPSVSELCSPMHASPTQGGCWREALHSVRWARGRALQPQHRAAPKGHGSYVARAVAQTAAAHRHTPTERRDGFLLRCRGRTDLRQPQARSTLTCLPARLPIHLIRLAHLAAGCSPTLSAQRWASQAGSYRTAVL